MAACTSLSFSWNNMLFAFGDTELTRSQSFSLPVTQRNRAIFGMVSRLKQDGAGVRKKYDAVIHIDGLPTKGILYITECTRTEYKCAFVFGELLYLKALHDKGTLDVLAKDYVSRQIKLTRGNIAGQEATQPTDLALLVNYDSENIPYKNKLSSIAVLKDADMIPSISIYRALWSYFDPTYESEEVERRVIPLFMHLHTMKRTEQDGSFTNDNYNAPFFNIFVPDTSVAVYGGAAGMTNGRGVKIQAWRLLDGVTASIYVPYGQNNNVIFMIRRKDETEFTFPDYGKCPNVADELGLAGYFSSNTTRPTVKRDLSYTLEEGDCIAFVGKEMWAQKTLADGSYNPSATKYGFMFASNQPLTTRDGHFRYNSDTKLCIGEMYDIAANIPALTIFDLLRTLYFVGCVFYIEDDYHIHIVDAGLAASSTIDLDDRVIEEKEIRRTFADFGQKNSVALKDDSFSLTYTIKNDNLEAAYTVCESPLATTETGGKVQEFEYETNSEGQVTGLKLTAKDPLLMYLSEKGDVHLESMNLHKIPSQLLTALCTWSTMVTLVVRMSFFEFARLVRYTTAYRYKNITWIATEAKWEDDRCELKLAKVSD